MKTSIQTSLDQTVEAIDVGDYERYIDSLITLATAIKGDSTDSTDYWSGEWSLWDMVDASYHHLTDYHEGQYSKTYEALSALSVIYKPSICGIYEESEGLKEIIDSMI